jgi:predicted O-methyltransferase YrrM
MSQFKRLVKACVRPFYLGLKSPGRPILRRLRDYFTQPILHWLEAAQRPLYERLDVVQAHLAVMQQQSLPWLVQQGQQTQHSVQNHLQTLQEVVQETDRLVLALLKTPAQAARHPVEPGLRVVPLGDHRILASHPVTSFLYLDTRELRYTPRLLLGDQGGAVLEALGRLVGPGDHVVEIGSGAGYFTLGLAQLVGPDGAVYAREPDPTAGELLQLNLEAHGLVPPVAVLDTTSALEAVLTDPDQPLALVSLASDPPPALLPLLVSALERNPSLRVLGAIDPLPSARRGLSDWLNELQRSGSRFSWVSPDGLLSPSAVDQLLATPPGVWGHYVTG